MKRFPLAAVCAVVFLVGCGAPVDSGPTILGITPVMQAQIREVVAESDPAADPDKVVADYMNQLRKIATGLNIQPNAAGDYPLPPEVTQYSEKLRAEGGVLGGLELLEEFDRPLPSWAAYLLNQYKAGTISPQHKELLVAAVEAELAGLNYQLSR